MKQIEAIGLQCSDCIIWRVGYTSLKMESGYSTRLPKSAPPGTVGWHGDSKNYETFDGLDIVPENIDKLCDWTLDPPSPYMTFAPHTPPYSTSKQKEKGK